MAPKNAEQEPVPTLNPSQWIRLIVVYLLIPLVLFTCAGDIGWWQAWIYSLMIFMVGIGGRLLAERRHPGLLSERANFNKASDVKPWDKVLSPLMALGVGFPTWLTVLACS